MQRKNVTFVLFLCLIAFLLVFAVAALGQAARAAGSWEYIWAMPVDISGTVLRPEIRTGVVMNNEGISFEGPVYQWLNALGAEGWELIEVIDGYYVFKRPVAS